jgi:tetratricopeptide (TPR) repeat protein
VRKKLHACLLAAVAAIALPAQPIAGALEDVHAALQAGEADKALNLLNSLPSSAEAHNLRCRVLFSVEHWDAAVNECQQAVTMEPQSSEYHMWLGRALGEKAGRASFLSAFSLAGQVRTEFEQAVRLDPKNTPALADLGEFYYNAPGIAGGGTDKAEGVAAQLEKIDPARASELRGRIAEKRHDYATAEQELKQAIIVSEHPAFQWMILASFYSRHNRWNDLDAVLQSGLAAAEKDRSANVALFNAASILNRCNRNLPLAAKLLEEYLGGSPKTEEAPAFVAHLRLAHIEAQLGDIPAARRERDAALELAHDYQPGQGLKF